MIKKYITSSLFTLCLLVANMGYSQYDENGSNTGSKGGDCPWWMNGCGTDSADGGGDNESTGNGTPIQDDPVIIIGTNSDSDDDREDSIPYHDDDDDHNDDDDDYGSGGSNGEPPGPTDTNVDRNKDGVPESTTLAQFLKNLIRNLKGRDLPAGLYKFTNGVLTLTTNADDITTTSFENVPAAVDEYKFIPEQPRTKVPNEKVPAGTELVLSGPFYFRGENIIGKQITVRDDVTGDIKFVSTDYTLEPYQGGYRVTNVKFDVDNTKQRELHSAYLGGYETYVGSNDVGEGGAAHASEGTYRDQNEIDANDPEEAQGIIADMNEQTYDDTQDSEWFYDEDGSEDEDDDEIDRILKRYTELKLDMSPNAFRIHYQNVKDVFFLLGKHFPFLERHPVYTAQVHDFLTQRPITQAIHNYIAERIAEDEGLPEDGEFDDSEILELRNSPFFEDDDQPNLKYTGTAEMFRAILDNSDRQVGKFKGSAASDYLKSLGDTEFNLKKLRIEPSQAGYFNLRPGRYIYTTKGGWIDMAHFMFYAGKAYSYKLDGEINPIGEAIQEGYLQEKSDKFFAPHSAYSYEDLPSDKFGAEFAVDYFNINSNLTFGEQIENYLNDVLGATSPSSAPNYNSLPAIDNRDKPTTTNTTTTPVFTTN